MRSGVWSRFIQNARKNAYILCLMKLDNTIYSVIIRYSPKSAAQSRECFQGQRFSCCGGKNRKEKSKMIMGDDLSYENHKEKRVRRGLQR